MILLLGTFMSWYEYILIYEVIITWQREERLDSNFVVALV